MVSEWPHGSRASACPWSLIPLSSGWTASQTSWASAWNFAQCAFVGSKGKAEPAWQIRMKLSGARKSAAGPSCRTRAFRRAEELAAEAHKLLGQGGGQITAGVWAAVAQTHAVLALA
jgi:hypothetical protein